MEKSRQNIGIQRWVAGVLESTVNVIAGFIALYSLYVAARPATKTIPMDMAKQNFSLPL